MFIAGIDYSLNSPAVCVYNGNKEQPQIHECNFYYLTKVKKYVGTFDDRFHGTEYPVYDHPVSRYTTIALWVVECLRRNRSTLYDHPVVKIEDYGFNANGRITDLAEHMGILKKTLYDMNISYSKVSVSSVKKTLTGKGNADKNTISELYKREMPSVFQLGKSPYSDCLDAWGVLLS